MPRSRALSRASSCDSFFDGEALRFVLAPSPSNTPGDVTQSNSPRSHCHTPGGGAYGDDYQAYHGIYRGSLPSAASIDSALRNVAVAEALQVPQAGSQWVQTQQVAETFEEGPANAANAWQDALAPLLRAPAAPAPQGAPLRRRSKASAEGPSLGFMWHSSPFAISRTPNIHTPVSHHSPARSPTSFSGYCSPIPGFPSGVASPNRRSGYSSPSTGLNAAAFFTGAAAAATQSGLMRRLMSLREAGRGEPLLHVFVRIFACQARGEEREEDSEWSSEDLSDGDGEAPDLLELLLKHAERVAPRRGGREPRSLCLDLSSVTGPMLELFLLFFKCLSAELFLELLKELLPVRLRGLLPCHAIPFLNAWVQALLACSPLCHLLAQVSWQKQPHQRPAYNCLMQLAWEFYGNSSELRSAAGSAAGSAGSVFNRLHVAASGDRGDHAADLQRSPNPKRSKRIPNDSPNDIQRIQIVNPPETRPRNVLHSLSQVDAAFLAEPLLRRFERGKSVQEAPVFPDLVGPDMFSCFLRFFLGELHDECKWPTLSAVPYQHEDSPMMRIFGGLVRKSHGRRVSTLGDGHAHTDVAPFLLLHLDLADPFGDPKTPISVEASVEQLLTRQEARFLRLPPFLLLHLHRFRTGSDGLPDRVNRKCRGPTRLHVHFCSYTLWYTRTCPVQSSSMSALFFVLPEVALALKWSWKRPRATPCARPLRRNGFGVLFELLLTPKFNRLSGHVPTAECHLPLRRSPGRRGLQGLRPALRRAKARSRARNRAAAGRLLACAGRRSSALQEGHPRDHRLRRAPRLLADVPAARHKDRQSQAACCLAALGSRICCVG